MLQNITNITYHYGLDLSIELPFREIVDRPAKFFLVAFEADFGAELDGFLCSIKMIRRLPSQAFENSTQLQ